MWKKNLSISILFLLLITIIVFFVPHDKVIKILEVNSPTEFITDKQIFKITEYQCFDSTFSEHNKNLAKELQISEEEAFILGNISKYWASNLITGRKMFISNKKDLIYYKYNYLDKFRYSGYCLKNNQPYVKSLFEKRLEEIRRANYRVYDLENNKFYNINNPQIRQIKNFLVIRKSHIPKELLVKTTIPTTQLDLGEIKILVTDSTIKLKPDTSCNTNICKEILSNINRSQKSIDIAIYGYKRIPKIEQALKNATERGVKIRLVYDLDKEGKNIYEDTAILAQIIPNNRNDKNSTESKYIMHNKFYIFDNKTLITGSANLSNTDMSGFNSNNIIVINSEKVAQIYKTEFEQMYNGCFHLAKVPHNNQELLLTNTGLKIYFSPQDKSINNAILTLIKNAKEYIYIPTFLLTNKAVASELISAKARGVDVKIIIDALNASNKHSKHNEMRKNNIPVKTENYAGKMHSKTILIDDKYTIIGSMNLSYSGENKNDENIIVIKNDKITKFYKDFFEYQWNKIPDKWLKNNVRAESLDSIGSCFDGIDNNYDELIDSDDPACKQ